MANKAIKSKLMCKNIYYMVAYCVEELKYFDESQIDFESISGTHDLLAVLLCRAFEHLYKSGCLRQYNKKTIITDKPIGKIDIAKSMQLGLYDQGKLVCTVTELNMNTELNRIVKAAFSALISSNNVIEDKINKKYLTLLDNYRLMLKDVGTIDINEELLDRKIDIPEQYKPVIIVSKMILKEWIAFDTLGIHRLLELNDEERLCRIWEKYLRTLIKNKFTDMNVSSPKFKTGDWRKDANGNTVYIVRRIDIQIADKKNNTYIIADAKWYNSEKDTIANRDQINKYCDECYKKHMSSTIRGVILYASDKTEETGGGVGGHDVEQTVYEININQDKEQLEADIVGIIKKQLEHGDKNG